MKKYLGLFVVLALVFVWNVQSLHAEDGRDENEVETKNSASLNDSEREQENDIGPDDVKSSLQEKRNFLKQEFETKKEEFKKQIESTREEAKNKFNALKEQIKSEKDAVKAKIKELRITGREQALGRFDDAVARIGELKNKVNTQISNFEAKGVDTTSAKSFVATADTKLTEAKNKVVEINNLLATSINELTLENKTKLRTLTQETQTLIVASHNALKDAIKSLREAVKAKMEAENVNTENKTENNNQ
jgi:hypothetical protein